MNEQNRKFLELERQILRDRAELNNLTEQCENNVNSDNIVSLYGEHEKPFR